MNRITVINRRAFLGGLVTAGAFVLGARLLPSRVLAASDAESAAWSPNLFLGLEPDGSVIIIAHRSEMGTGIRTALPMVVADELDADWERVRIEQGIGDDRYGSQNTDGSQSIRDFYDTMREAGATARQMLVSAAAKKWNVPVSECSTGKHGVLHAKTNRRLGYGALVADAAKQPVPKKEELQFKSPADFRYIGKDMPVSNLQELCSGRGIFGIDATMPGMVHASIERSPVLGGTLKSHDDSEALKVKGVQRTVVLDGFKGAHGFQALGGVAVIADNTWSAMKGRQALKVTWDPGANAGYNSEPYRKELLTTVSRPQKAARNVGDVDAAFAKAGTIHEAHYYVPHLAHAPMEPPVAVAEVKDGRALIYAATQNPQAVQDTVAAALGIDKKNVECHVTLLGGGFGRKSKPDYVAEAALLSKAVGKPVKVTWTREDDIRFDYLHSVAAMYLKAALDANGRPTALLKRSAFPTIVSTFNGSATEGAPWELGMGWTDMPFDIPNIRAENGPAKHHVRIGWLRSVSNIYHAFALHSFIDELAHLAKRDPVEYLLDLLGKPRKIDFPAEGTNYTNYGKPLEQFPVD
ncbi:MAG TPA: twin-arginine translocation pathway signal protein, partial [Verrucomicrobiales bacterium]|nr:twin-arginine translocation pathway signal protein [Verrucomicrobiales bacterium]